MLAYAGKRLNNININHKRLNNIIINHKRPLTPKSMPPTGDEHAQIPKLGVYWEYGSNILSSLNGIE